MRRRPSAKLAALSCSIVIAVSGASRAVAIPAFDGVKLPPPSTDKCTAPSSKSTKKGVALVSYCGPARVAVQFHDAVDDAGTKVVTFASGICDIEKGPVGPILVAHFGTDITDGSSPDDDGIKVRGLELDIGVLKDQHKIGGAIMGWYDTFGLANVVNLSMNKDHRNATLSKNKDSSESISGSLDCGKAMALPPGF